MPHLLYLKLSCLFVVVAFIGIVEVGFHTGRKVDYGIEGGVGAVF